MNMVSFRKWYSVRVWLFPWYLSSVESVKLEEHESNHTNIHFNRLAQSLSIPMDVDYCNVLYSISAIALPMTLYIYILHASVTRFSCCCQFLFRYSLK